MKAINILAMLVWIFQFVLGIVAACGKVTINPIVFMCAVLICIIHYVDEVFK